MYRVSGLRTPPVPVSIAFCAPNSQGVRAIAFTITGCSFVKGSHTRYVYYENLALSTAGAIGRRLRDIPRS